MATYRNVEIPDILTQIIIKEMMARMERRIKEGEESFLCNYYFEDRSEERVMFTRFLMDLGIITRGWGFDDRGGVRQWIIDLGPTPNQRRLQLLKEIYEQL